MTEAGLKLDQGGIKLDLDLTKIKLKLNLKWTMTDLQLD